MCDKRKTEEQEEKKMNVMWQPVCKPKFHSGMAFLERLIVTAWKSPTMTRLNIFQSLETLNERLH